MTEILAPGERAEPEEPPEEPGPPSDPEQPEERKPRRFPTAFTVLAGVLLFVWVLSFFIPSGSYEVDPETGGPKPGTYEEVDIDREVAAPAPSARQRRFLTRLAGQYRADPGTAGLCLLQV